MKRNFKEWLNNFKTSIADYSYYVDFNKVYKNTQKLKEHFNILNSIIGSKNIEEDFKNIVNENPEVLKCIPILLAVRSKEIFVKDDIKEYLFNFDKQNYAMEDYIKFMHKSGLFNLLQNNISNNLYDYVLGIEAGLDSNGRKNRGGHIMERLVESYILKAGYVKNETYFKEVTTDRIKKMFGVDILAHISNDDLNKSIAKKRFDFVVVKGSHYYLFETNFYASGGSKLNETARSYKMLARELADLENVTFVWVTDGVGWNNAKGNLEETFDELDTLYNIDDLEKGLLETI